VPPTPEPTATPTVSPTNAPTVSPTLAPTIFDEIAALQSLANQTAATSSALPEWHVANIDIVWGISGIDRSQVSSDFPNGKATYDNSFDPHSPEALEHMRQTCMRPFDMEYASRLKTRISARFNEHKTNGHSCFMQDLHNNSKWGGRLTMPDLNKDRILIRKFQEHHEQKYSLVLKTCCVERASTSKAKISERVVDKSTNKSQADCAADVRVSACPCRDDDVGTDDDSCEGWKIVWAGARIITDIDNTQVAHVAEADMNRWIDYMNERNADAAKQAETHGVSRATQSCMFWVRTMTELTLLRSTILAWVISNVCAFGSIALFTGNILLGIWTVVTILFIVTCLFAAMIILLGWPFGAIEAVSVTIFVGFSVDYCLHLAHSFNNAKGNNYSRVRQSLTELGSSITGAAVTTFASSIPLFFCTIQVFVQMGKTVALNTVFSIYFALVFYTALLVVVGPKQSNFFQASPSFRRPKIDLRSTFPSPSVSISASLPLSPPSSPPSSPSQSALPASPPPNVPETPPCPTTNISSIALETQVGHPSNPTIIT